MTVHSSFRELLPQLEAFLHEVNRHLSLGPIWRRLALKDSEIMGYKVIETYHKIYILSYKPQHS